ncbi:hypothetical protein GCM10025771_20510 [Niveibacterium umoris]|uniref:Uncharacterized protein n=1 Tax=Niveibacterium umoris TaxID=1193620 RepID=A0A840BMK9_9RHOO|nr:hypothetical protein [Niveibacterium umoris]MBB4012759.1 hypothetical protein [Niveibacterium umoris]
MKLRRPGGFALPIVLILLSAVAVFVAVKTLRTFNGFDLRASMRTDRALGLAREALIQHAVWEDSSPGALPCPDLDNNGTAASSCAAGAIGRLPWRTLGMEPPTDASGECLWYALSPGARSQLAPSTRGPGGTQPALNPDYTGELDLTDSATATVSKVVAVIIAPGRALPGQVRTGSASACNDGVPSAFLDSRTGIDNAGSGMTFVSGPPDDAFNDRILAITSADLFTAVAPRVLVELSMPNRSSLSGLRMLFGIGGSFSPASLADGSKLKLDFLNPTVISAFPAPPLPASAPDNPKIEVQDDGGCPHYVVTRDDGVDALGNPLRKSSGAPGNFAIEWLCFNRWLDYIGYAPADTSARLDLSSRWVGKRGWEAVADSAAPVTLTRTPSP